MITLEMVADQWEKLDAKDGLVAAHQFDHIVFPNGSPLIIKDFEGLHHLLIPIGDADKVYEDKRSAGVHVVISEWGDPYEFKRFIDVKCLKPHLNDLFDMIVLEILKEFETNIFAPDKTCRNVISNWRELINKEPVNLPGKTELLGIFGELWALRKMARINPDSINIWVGPHGARVDFINSKYSLEVKSTLQRKGCVITIHGINQLEPSVDSCLYLAVFKFEEVPVGGETIIDLANEIISCGCERSTLFSKLANLDITVANINECSDLRFRMLEERIFRVDNEFPSITTKSFKDNRLPKGVIDLIYQIDLSTEPPSPLSDNEADEFFYRISGGDI